MRGGNGLVRTVGASMIGGSKMPQLEALWGAGFSYNKCHAEKRVPVDSHTLWMFDGEEFLRASRLWTHGYDMYSPSKLGTVVYHNYTTVPARFESIPVDHKRKDKEEEMGTNRFKVLVGQPFEGRVSTIELKKYGFGKVRSFQQYLGFSGVTFEEGKKDAESCEQLHWVPYTNATEVERVSDSVSVDTFSSSTSMLLVLVAGTLFVVFSNDRVSRNIRRHCRAESQHTSKE
ncbi:hypothetical protein PI124_g18025 [Phytophthora idaei]|nr:hypothetical protein PI124_g18025 [Phytophthora idaei]